VDELLFHIDLVRKNRAGHHRNQCAILAECANHKSAVWAITDIGVTKLAAALDGYFVGLKTGGLPGGWTLTEAWDEINPYQRLPKEIRYVVGWDGLLAGFYSRY
jgi:hypothetical protein